MSPPVIKKSSKLVRVRQMIRCWRRRSSSSRWLIATDVPAGHVAVCVGSNCKRFIVRATYLNHPIFQKLLREAEEEYGFTNIGPLMIPCEEADFEQIIRFLSRPETDNHKKPKVEELQRCGHVEYLGESMPLLRGSVC